MKKVRIIKINDNWNTGLYECTMEDEKGIIETYEINKNGIDLIIKEQRVFCFLDLVGLELFIYLTPLHKIANN
jgi:hypothetical protein